MTDAEAPLPEKRSAEPSVNEGVKRRAPYVFRACDTCRRRKGRCDGNKPCGYCSGRSGECKYTFTGDERRANVSTHGAVKTESDGTRQLRMSMPPSSMTSLNEAVAQMQEQLNALAARVDSPLRPDQVRSSNSNQVLGIGMNSTSGTYSPITQSQAMTHASPSTSTSDQDSMISSSKKSRKRYIGPTSPDYSFNVAWSKARGSSVGVPGATTGTSPAIEDDSSEGEGLNALPEQNGFDIVQQRKDRMFTSLTHFRNLMNKQSALHHVRLYQEVIGELHPLIEAEWLLSLTECVFEDAELENREIDLIILNLALCISLCAELMSISAIAQMIFNTCQDLVNAQLMGIAKDPKQAIIAILVGFYHFFTGHIPLALRMIGVAGRHMMELGLHNREASRQWTPYTEFEISTLSCNLVILDRQWAASSGLPPNFKFEDFELATKNAVQSDHPYLKAMINFTLMSQDFNDPVTRVARGKPPIDTDELEILKFKVQQWRANVLTAHGFDHPSKWTDQTGYSMAAWKLIIYLRANAVIAILLRPYFLHTPSKSTEQQVEPALDIVHDTVTFLQIVDKSTDNYKKQHPLLQHFLSSSCSLLFLVVAYLENTHSILASTRPQCLSMVKDSWDKALRLSAAYKEVSFASRRLFKRLMGMKQSLSSLGVLLDPQSTVQTSPMRNSSVNNVRSDSLDNTLFYPQLQAPGELTPAFGAQAFSSSMSQSNVVATEGPEGSFSRFLMEDFTNPSNYRAFEYL